MIRLREGRENGLDVSQDYSANMHYLGSFPVAESKHRRQGLWCDYYKRILKKMSSSVSVLEI